MRKKQQATKKSKGKSKGKNKGRSRKKVAKASASSAAREPTSPLPTIGEVQSPLTARSTRSHKPSIKPQPVVHQDDSKSSDTPAAAPAAGGEATALGALGVDESLLADAQALSAALADTESDASAVEGSAGTADSPARAIAAAPARVTVSRMSPSCGMKCARESDPERGRRRRAAEYAFRN